jgi:hypothetical protein
MAISPARISVEVAREHHEQAIIALEQAKRRELEARWKLNEALDKLENSK